MRVAIALAVAAVALVGCGGSSRDNETLLDLGYTCAQLWESDRKDEKTHQEFNRSFGINPDVGMGILVPDGCEAYYEARAEKLGMIVFATPEEEKDYCLSVLALPPPNRAPWWCEKFRSYMP